MSWQSEITTIVRHLIDDTNITSPAYSNDRIETAILVSAQLVLNEVDFERTYTVNVDTCTLTPDPTTGNKDDGFINILALKTACIILRAELKQHSLKAVKVTDGPSSVDTTSIATALKAVYEDLCKQYDTYKYQFASLNNNLGKAVLSPYSPGSKLVRGWR